jgi:hypothetical protein
MSASAPAGRPTRTTGNIIAVWTSATSVGDESRSPISQIAPTLCIIDPMFEAICAMKSARKTRLRSGAHADVAIDLPSARSDQGRSCHRGVLVVRFLR